MGTVRLLRVDTNGNPSKDTIIGTGAKPNVVHDRVHGSSFFGHDSVGLVLRQGLFVGRVRREGLDFIDESLVEEDL